MSVGFTAPALGVFAICSSLRCARLSPIAVKAKKRGSRGVHRTEELQSLSLALNASPFVHVLFHHRPHLHVFRCSRASISCTTTRHPLKLFVRCYFSGRHDQLLTLESSPQTSTHSLPPSPLLHSSLNPSTSASEHPHAHAQPVTHSQKNTHPPVLIVHMRSRTSSLPACPESLKRSLKLLAR